MLFVVSSEAAPSCLNQCRLFPHWDECWLTTYRRTVHIRRFPIDARWICSRTINLPGRLRVTVKSGLVNPLPRVEDGECIEIMTGAPVPAGADAILMVEHAERDGDLIETIDF